MGRTKRKFRDSKPEPLTRPFVLPKVKLGHFTANNVRMEEASINNLVLRIELKRETRRPSTIEDASEDKPGISGVRLRSCKEILVPKQHAGNRLAGQPPPKQGAIKNGAKVQRRKQMLIPRRLNKAKRNELSQNGVLKSKKRMIKHIPDRAWRRFYPLKTIKRPRKRWGLPPELRTASAHSKPARKEKVFKLIFPKRTKVSSSVCHFNWTLLHAPELLCQLTLPSPAWCVNLVRTNDQTPITFSILNKVQQRGVIFNKMHDQLTVIVKGQSVRLLGCPTFVYSIDDLETLVRIVHKMKLDDSMLMKVKE